MNNFKQAIVKSNVYQKLKTDPDANPNNNYEILSAVIMESKVNHLPKKTLENCKKTLINTNIKKKNGCHLHDLNQLYIKIKFIGIGRSTTDNNEYQIKQVNFKTYERILKKHDRGK